jgi:hypothetical protein
MYDDAEVPRQRQKKKKKSTFCSGFISESSSAKNPHRANKGVGNCSFRSKEFRKQKSATSCQRQEGETNTFKGLMISEVKFYSAIHFGAVTTACCQYSSFPRTFCFLLAYS